MSKVRLSRLTEEIKRELSHIINTEIKDPRVKGLISITKVEVTGDLRHAKVFVSNYGSKEEIEQSIIGLETASGFIRTELGQRIRARYIPELIFKSDASMEHGAKISKILAEIGKNQEDDNAGSSKD